MPVVAVVLLLPCIRIPPEKKTTSCFKCFFFSMAVLRETGVNLESDLRAF